jgi:hypothetical protein
MIHATELSAGISTGVADVLIVVSHDRNTGESVE